MEKVKRKPPVPQERLTLEQIAERLDNIRSQMMATDHINVLHSLMLEENKLMYKLGQLLREN
jgi:hypothetical protein